MTEKNIGFCPYCNIQMSAGGSSLADANGWQCPECQHEEVEMGSYKLSGSQGPVLTCRCENCQVKRGNN